MVGSVYFSIFGLFYLINLGDFRSASTINYPLATTPSPAIETSTLSRYERGLEDYDEEQRRIRAETRQSRGMFDDDDPDEYSDENYLDHDHSKEDSKEDMKDEEKAVKADPWAGYYDFIITEGSFKFWAAFQLATALLLVYSACAAVYYAKFNPIAPDYDYYDDFFGRSDSGTPAATNSWLSMETVERILNAINSKKYA